MSAADASIPWLAIAAGGALGATARWLIAGLAARTARRMRSGVALAGGTLAVNLLACGLFGGLTASGLASTEAGAATTDVESGRVALGAFLATGFCGSLSTWSTLCLDAVRLGRAHPPVATSLYLLAHVLGGSAALWAGARLAG